MVVRCGRTVDPPPEEDGIRRFLVPGHTMGTCVLTIGGGPRWWGVDVVCSAGGVLLWLWVVSAVAGAGSGGCPGDKNIIISLWVRAQRIECN